MEMYEQRLSKKEGEIADEYETTRLAQKLLQLQDERIHTFKLFEEGYKIYLASSPNYDFAKFRELVSEVTKDFKRISSDIITIQKQFHSDGYTLLANMIDSLQDEEENRLKLCAKLQIAKQDAIDNPHIPEKWNDVAVLKEIRRIRNCPTKSWISILYTIVLILILVNVDHVNACGPGRRSNARRNPRKLTPLVFKQHIPNVSENTLGASGLSEGRVSRHHKRFKELVPNYNADIIFKDDEGTGADRLMTQRLKEKLNTLAISVMNQWPGVKLRVTQSWHEGNSYNGDSLHYEGRAVDITTSDKDRSKLGMLARLAVEAGFDWVYYESRVWIHCSVKSEQSDSARNGGCFDQDSIVYDRNGPKSIMDVKIGDQIMSVDDDGRYEYSEVLMFLDRDQSIERLYYHLQTESGSTITATPSHLLFVSEPNGTPFNTVKIDQNLYEILRITTSLGHGAYAPLTSRGNLVVNNITASCYAVIESQTLTHLSFIPIRMAHWFVQLGDRLSNQLLSNSISSRTDHRTSSTISTPQEGVHWYAKLLYHLFRRLIPSRMVFT
ncbi:hypothetical protein RDWZM_002667 [Blomia tropicalis]|uniref:Hedgehog protein n=1 Tax=Blomia tropicalis TaxID=40697 RepID=A0A9Q0MEC8_BLOTA|nr:hypothetical protein RDWZM_002667 [Blomia tropicalis]